MPPIHFDPSLEHVAADEAETRAALIDTLRGIATTTNDDYGHAVRSVHAKSYALLEGEITIPALPPELAQGAFARPGTYPVVMRFSTNPGDILDDAVSAPRGLAIKIVGVDGPRLPGSDGAVTQDFVMANGPAFVAPDAKAFLGSLKMLAATTDRAEGAKMALSKALRGVATVLKAVGAESPLVTNMGGQPLTHPLGETFYSQAPLRWGDHVGKVSVAPASANLNALQDRPLALNGDPNALRQAAIDAAGGAACEWDVRVQLCTDATAMPIEDASVAWPEELSPYRVVARLRAAPQPAWSEARAARADDRLSFSPWHGLAAHQPLGSINRARRPAYAELAALRAQQNDVAIEEPRGPVGLSTAPASAVGTTPGREGFRNASNARTTAPSLAPNLALRTAAGAAGGLVGGLLVSAAMALKQAVTGQPSDLVQLERGLRGAAAPTWLQPQSGTGEEAAAHGGHLALSALSGAAYGAIKPDGVGPVAAGLTFGLGFRALAYGGAGPALDVTPVPWRETKANTAQHLVLHAVFGLATALVADRLTRKCRRRTGATHAG